MPLMYQFIQNAYFWILLSLLIIIFVLIFFNKKKIINVYHLAFDKKTLVFFILILLLSGYLRIINIMNNDSIETLANEYRTGAKTFYLTQKYQSCLSGTILHCLVDTTLPRHVQGYSFLLSLIYFVTGPSENVAFVFNAILGILAVVIAYLASYIFFKNKKTALLSALSIGVLPRLIWWGTTGEVVIANIFFIGLSLITLGLCKETNDYLLYALSFFVIMFTAHIRSENIFFLLILIGIFIFKNSHQGDIPSSLKKNSKNYFWGIILSIYGLGILLFNIIISKYASTQQGDHLITLNPSYILMNLGFIYQIWHKLPLVIFAIGLIILILNKKGRSSSVVILATIFIHLLMLSTFYQSFPSGTPTNAGIGNMERYLTTDILPLVVCGCEGLFVFIVWITRALPLNRKSGKSVLITILFLISLYLLSVGADSLRGVPIAPYNDSTVIFQTMILELKPNYLMVSSPEMTQYVQFIRDDLPATWMPDKSIYLISPVDTKSYYVELVSPYFPEKSVDYFFNKNITPAKIIGNFYIYNIKSVHVGSNG